MEVLEVIANYIFSVALEGLALGFLFWAITYITVESTSLPGAIKAGLGAEIVGNLPYLAKFLSGEQSGREKFLHRFFFCENVKNAQGRLRSKRRIQHI